MAATKRWTRLNWARQAGGAALALTAVLAAAGCGPAAAAGAASPGSSPDNTPPAISATQAREVFDSYVAATAKANRTGDATLALSVVTGVQQAAVETAVTESRFFGVKPSLAPYSFRRPTFYLPEQGSYPRFFVASAVRQRNSVPKPTPSSAPAAESAGGVAVPRDGTALLLFEQQSATGPWQLASVSALPAGTSMPRLAVSASGAIPQVPLSSTDLLARPDVTGALQAAVVDDGPASAAAKAVAAGPLTTGMYRGMRDHVLGLRPPEGDIYQWELEGSNLAKFALRTADGGALVFYAMYLNITVAIPGFVENADPMRPGPLIRYQRDLEPWLSPTVSRPRVSLEKQQLLSFAAIDPPPGKAKLRVITVGGTLNFATAS